MNRSAITRRAAPRTGMRRGLLAVLLAAVIGAASAHAYLEKSDPADGAVLAAAPDAITLSYTEGVEVGFSLFKLYRLDNDLDPADPNYTARLDGLAAVLVTSALDATAPDERSLDFTLAPATGQPTSLTLTPNEPLTAGSYVVMWRVLSVDTHVLQAFIAFTVAP